jgi:hypothetical protein
MASASRLELIASFPDSMSLLEARTLFFRRANLGADGGYSSRWVRVEAKPFSFYFPNSRARMAAVGFHDLHHIATEYDTNWPGEIEISGWEIASGCERFYVAWILDLGAWAIGLLLAPKRLFRAFLRGRNATTNLYKTGFPHSQLAETTVGELRARLGIRKPPPPAKRCDVTAFAFWSAAAIAMWAAPPALAAAIGWYCLSSRRR